MKMQNSRKKHLCLLALIIMFFGINNVEAKNTILECSYYSEAYSLAGYAGANIDCDIYSDYSHMCYIDYKDKKNNEEEILNWSSDKDTGFMAKDYVESNDACPTHLYVQLKTGFMVFDGFKIYASKNKEMLSDLETLLRGEKDDSWHSAVIRNYEYTDEEKEVFNSNVDGYTKTITEEYQKYDFDKCIDEGAIAGNTYACSEQLSGLTMLVNSSENQINEWIKAEKISESDESVKSFREAVSTAEEKIKTATEELNNYNKEKEQPGYTVDPKTGKPIDCSVFVYVDENDSNNKINLIADLFNIIMIVAPILAIVLGSLDFAKASLAQDEKELKKAGTNFGKRLIAAVLLFILPLIINLVLGIAFDAGIFDGHDVPEVCLEQK